MTLRKIGDNALNIFHLGIIAYLCFVALGCGYKAAPYYGDSQKSGVEIIADSASVTQTKAKNEI